MLADFSRAFSQIFTPAFRRVLWRSLGLTLLAYVLIGIGASYAIEALPHFETRWLNEMVRILSGIGLVAALAFLFPAAVSVFLSLFLDDVALAVEERHYPSRPLGQPLPFGPALLRSLGFAGLVLALNLLALPLYVLMLWFPPTNMVIFYSLNGYLLGREYFELVAWRHLDRKTTSALRRSYRGRVFLAGVIIAGMFSIPLLNLLAPIVATAAMVHQFYKMRPVG